MKQEANKMRPGWVIEHNGRTMAITKIALITPGRWGSFVQAEMKDIDTGSKTNERFRSADVVEKLTTDTQDAQYLYKEGDSYVFMNKETYEQLAIPSDMLGDSAAFLQDNMDVAINYIETRAIGIDLPQSVILTVTETEPYLKGQTVTTSYKPAIMDNGVRVMVPPFVTVGEKIVVATADSSYVERAK